MKQDMVTTENRVVTEKMDCDKKAAATVDMIIKMILSQCDNINVTKPTI